MTELSVVLDDIAAMGAVFGPDILQRTRALYRPLVERQSWMHRPVHAEIAYGPHVRHRLDLYPASEPGAPVLMFVHGGGFIGGDKAGDSVFYGNVGRYFAEQGFCTVAINYRLAQTHVWPAGAEDLANAIRWVVEHIAEHGGDPTCLLLLGQSAGASHCATYLFDPRIESDARPLVKGVALMSGFYLAQDELADGPLSYFGEDRTRWADRSPATHVSAGHPPMLLSIAELDPAAISVHTLDLARAITLVDGRSPRFRMFEGQNHVSTVHGLGLGDDPVGSTLLRFFREALA